MSAAKKTKQQQQQQNQSYYGVVMMAKKCSKFNVRMKTTTEIDWRMIAYIGL